MAGSPRYKLYSPDGEYLGSVKYPEHAAGALSMVGVGATLRAGHNKRHTVWTEGDGSSMDFETGEMTPGNDGIAAESYDTLTETVAARDN